MRLRWVRASGLLAMVAMLAACGGGGGQGDNSSPMPSPSIPAGAVVIRVVADSQTVGAFNPASATAKVGQAVAWVFEDSSSQHTVTADDDSFDSGAQSAGYVFTHTFSQSGVYKYHCTLHAEMVAHVTVTQ